MKAIIHTILLTLGLTSGTILHAASTIQFSATTYTVAEDAGAVTITIQRWGDTGTVVSVDYATTNGTATAGLKYTAVSGTLSFAAGQTNQTLVVPILNEAFVEGTKTFRVLLSNPMGGAVLGTRASTTVSISDNDRALRLELGAYSVKEDAREVTIRVIRGDDGNFPVSVDYAAIEGTAKAGLDYTAVASTLTFKPGEFLKSFTIPILNDTVAEPGRTFRVVLSNLTGDAVLGTPSQASVAITDTDGIVEFASAAYQVLEDAAFVQVRLTRGESDSAASVDLTTADISAVSGADYVGITNTIQFGPGERFKVVNTPILDDGLKEAKKTFRLDLSNPTGGATLGTRRRTTITIVDDDPGIGFEQTTYTVGKEIESAEVHVRRGNSQLLDAISMNYQTVDGSALAGVDYVPITGTLEFKANESIRSLHVPLLRAPGSTSGKSFTLTLSDATGGIPLGTATTKITIVGTTAQRSYPVVPSMRVQLARSHAEGLNLLTWDGNGVLVRADRAEGPWERLLEVQSPYANQPWLPMRYFQVQSSRPTKVYVPSRYDGQTPLPLVLVLHGYGGTAAWMEGYFRFQAEAEARGLLLCYPEGISDTQGSRFWNATDACCNFYGALEDDSAYLRELIESIGRRFSVDRKRIYVTGLSNGGFMSHRMASDHSDLIAAVAPFAGMPFLDFATHRPTHPVSVLHIQGTSDETVPYAGGGLIGLPVTALFPSALKTMELWAAQNGCQGLLVDSAPSLDLVSDVAGLDTMVSLYTNAPPGGAVELWTINRATHVPTLSADFPRKVIDWFLAHPKP